MRPYAVVLGRTQSKRSLPGVSGHKRKLHQQRNLCPQFNVRDSLISQGNARSSLKGFSKTCYVVLNSEALKMTYP